MQETTEGGAFTANVTVEVVQTAGTTIGDTTHVARWMAADATLIGGVWSGFTFTACPEHDDPEECECSTLPAQFRARILSVDLDAQEGRLKTDLDRRMIGNIGVTPTVPVVGLCPVCKHPRHAAPKWYCMG